MSDASSSTPFLTPQSTGTQDSSSPASSGKSRPQAAFYPNVNAVNKEQKPFSRSAAKRDSVMALGSIEHLQHYFTKTGLITKKETKQKKGLVSANGSFNTTHTKGTPSLSSPPEFELPPSPALPTQSFPTITPYVKTFEVDPENLRPGVTQDLTVVEGVWRLRTDDSAQSPDPSLLSAHPHGGGGFDVLRALKVTTHAIRSVRNYLLSLPDEYGVSRSQPRRQTFRPASLSTSEPQKRRVSSGTDRTEPLARIRRAALDVLTVLRELEENARVPLSDDAYDAGSDRSSRSRIASPAELSDVPTDSSFSVSVMRVGGRRESILVWDEEEDDFNVDEESERVPRERWDERLVLGSGWLYRQDIKIEELGKQQSAIAKYLDTVDEVMFGGRKGDLRGWASEQERLARREKGRRSSAPLPDSDSSASPSEVLGSAGMVESMPGLSVTDEPDVLETLAEEEHGDVDGDGTSSLDDEDLPRWAQRSAFMDSELHRTHALVVALLPASLLCHLPTSPDRAKLLDTLSSGQLLCVAYNIGVRHSRKPWGYINDDSIHDIVALEDALSASAVDGSQAEKGRKGWTFRRTDNLRLWGAALRLRYMLPIISPATPDVPTSKPSPTAAATALAAAAEPAAPPSPSTPTAKSSEIPIFFDARVVARRDDGWEDMLERALLRWTSVVVEERRNRSR